MTNSLFVKMARIMGEIDQIAKDEQMDAGKLKYKYVSDAAVYHRVRGLLAREGIALFASTVEVEQQRFVVGEDQYGNERDKWHTKSKFEYVLADSETGDTMTCTWFAESEDSADKGVNKAATAALKFWLLKTFIIPTGDDPDAENGAQPDQPTRRAKDAPPQETEPTRLPVRAPRKSKPRRQSKPVTDEDPARPRARRVMTQVWNTHKTSLLEKTIPQLLLEGEDLWRLIYGVEDFYIAQLGYTSTKHVKEELGIESTKEWTGSLGSLLVEIVLHAPNPDGDAMQAKAG